MTIGVVRDGLARCWHRVFGTTPPPPERSPAAAAPTPAPWQSWRWDVVNELPALVPLSEAAQTCLATVRPVPPEAATLSAVSLVLDEMLTNVIKYAHPGEAPGGRLITVGLHASEQEICVEIEDDGVAFDPIPTASVPPPAEVPLEQQTIGGWGLPLVYKTVSTMHYRREGDRNHVILRLNLAAPTFAPGGA